MKKWLLVSLSFGCLLVGISATSNVTYAKSNNITTYSQWGNKVSFKYTQKHSRSFNVSKKYSLDNINYSLKLRGLSYYKLSPKHNKRLLIRAYYTASSPSAHGLQLFDDFSDVHDPYLNTNQGDRLYQTDSRKGAYPVIELHGKDIAKFSVDYLSTKNISFGEFKSGSIHFASSAEQIGNIDLNQLDF